MQRRSFITVAGTVLAAPLAHAQAGYPSQQVRMVLGFAPGGGVDTAARIVAKKLSEQLGQLVVVENKPGASNILAMSELQRSKPYGYTLGVSGSNRSTMDILFQKLPFNAANDFISVAPLANVPVALVAGSALPVKTMAELISYSKTHAGLMYGTPGIGTPNHLAGVLLSNMIGAQMVHAPYKGSLIAVQDVLGGHLPLAMLGLSTALQHMDSGRLRILGVGSAKRSELAPQVPTIAEGGVTGYEASYWTDFILPKGTSQPIIERLHAEISKAVQSPEVRAAYVRDGYETMVMPFAEYQRLLQKEQAKWEDLVKINNIKLD